ncbi:MAG: hypothetical protein JWM27_1230, partial [Gemmatimonadetes bacterium]|nr:hypothetical protein [Gemmatimonadota bacterium]
RVEPRRPDPPARGADQDFGRASSGSSGSSSSVGSFGGGRASSGGGEMGGRGRPGTP